MPDGSSSAAPVTRPGPSRRSAINGVLGLVTSCFRCARGMRAFRWRRYGCPGKRRSADVADSLVSTGEVSSMGDARRGPRMKSFGDSNFKAKTLMFCCAGTLMGGLPVAVPAHADELAPGGTLRATYIAANPVQASVDPATGALRGPAAAILPDLARGACV